MQTGRLLKSNFNSSIVRNVKIKQNKKSIIKTYSFIYSHKILSCTWSVLYIFFQFDFWMLLSYLLLLVGCLVMFSGLSSSTIQFFSSSVYPEQEFYFFFLLIFFLGFKDADCTKSSVIFCFCWYDCCLTAVACCSCSSCCCLWNKTKLPTGGGEGDGDVDTEMLGVFCGSN